MNLRSILLTFILVLTSACAQVTLTRNDQPRKDTTVRVEERAYFFWGFFPRPKLTESELCPGARLDAVKFSRTSGDVWLYVVTLGIYVPHRVEILCAK